MFFVIRITMVRSTEQLPELGDVAVGVVLHHPVPLAFVPRHRVFRRDELLRLGRRRVRGHGRDVAARVLLAVGPR